MTLTLTYLIVATLTNNNNNLSKLRPLNVGKSKIAKPTCMILYTLSKSTSYELLYIFFYGLKNHPHIIKPSIFEVSKNTCFFIWTRAKQPEPELPPPQPEPEPKPDYPHPKP